MNKETLYLAAAEAGSFEEIVDKAYELLNIPIVLADSLHYIIALSPDVREKHGKALSWQRLVELGCTAPLRESSRGEPIPTDGIKINEILLMHKTTTVTGQPCVMCDVIHEGSTIMKLSLVGSCPEDAAAALGRSLYLAYFRIRFTAGSPVDDKSRFLLNLLSSKGGETALPFGGIADFDLDGPFVAASLSLGRMDILNLTFAAVTAELSRLMPRSYLAALNSGEYAILLNVSQVGGDFWERFDRYIREHGAIVGVSRSFDDVLQTAAFHGQANGAARAAEHFSAFSGIARYDDFSLFMMFDILAEQDHDHSLENPLVDVLAQSDDEKKTDYLRTLFCWLLNSKRAPATAIQLAVHRNTLDNRIAKIHELIDPDFDNESLCIGLMYSLYMALRSRGRLEYFRKDTALQ